MKDKDGFKADFPLLENHIENGKPLVYLDNAATTQKPAQVIDAVEHYYEESAASPHRGAYTLSADATALYEGARAKAAGLISAASAEEVVFVKNATEALNLVALGYGMQVVGEGDEILISIAEHHSNLLPWQAVARAKSAKLVYMYTNAAGELPLAEVEAKLTARTRIVAVTHTSNVLGIHNPVKEIARLAHEKGAVVVLDGAQGVPHTKVDVGALDVDFMAFSGHKMLSPGGVGVLYGKAAMLEELQPVMLGGGIVEQVTEQTVRLLPAPARFEPGTPNVEGAVGLAAAIDYMESIGGYPVIEEKEAALGAYMLAALRALPEVEVYGGAENAAIAPFNVKGVHPHDVASILDASGVTVRAGHHCAQPLMGHLGISSCCRASVSFYNTKEDIDKLIEAVKGVRGWLGL